MTYRVVALAALLVLAGCAAPVDDPEARGPWTWPEDPPTDRLGWEEGVWYNESIAVEQSDGLNASERRAFVARTMARVEVLRGLEFEKRVPVQVVSREAFRDRSGGGSDERTARERYRDSLWEAMLLVGEDRTFQEARSAVYGGAVQGYYSPGKDRIVIVSDTRQPTIDRVTLAHELVHALQDQHLSFLGSPVRDTAQAHTGLTEGDASYVESLYQERCGQAWDCVARPEASSAGSPIAPENLGLYVAIYFPYSDGPNFVYRLRARGGWAAVNAAYDDPPTTTEQIIHPELYPEEGAVPVAVPDRSSAAWSRYDVEHNTDRVGQASLFTAFWFHRQVPRSSLFNDSDRYSLYDYESRVTDGWAGDRLVPYEREGGATGYVWRLRWETTRDARQFAEAYRALLTEGLNATQVRPGVYRVPESNTFGDAFRVTRNGRTVTIVNAPRPRGLDDVHAPE